MPEGRFPIALAVVHPVRAWRRFTQALADHADARAREAGLTVEVLPGGVRRYRDPRLDQLAADRAGQARRRTGARAAGRSPLRCPRRSSPQRRSQPAGARRSPSRRGGRREPGSTLASTPWRRAPRRRSTRTPDGSTLPAEPATPGENLPTKSRTAAASAAGSPPRWGRGVPGPQPRIKPVCA